MGVGGTCPLVPCVVSPGPCKFDEIRLYHRCFLKNFVKSSEKRILREPLERDYLSFCFYLFIITLFEANSNKNQLTNIKTFIRGESYREKTLHKTQAQSIFSCCFKLVLSSAIDLLDFIELGS